MPMTARIWAMAAMTAPNMGYLGSNIGPRNNETMKKTKRMAAFQTMGPREMTAILIRGLGGCLPFAPGKALTNMYATTNITAIMRGKRTSETMTARQLARGTSPDSFSEG